MFVQLLIITVVAIVLVMLGIGIKMLVKKNGQFVKQCSIKDPNTGKSMGCSCGGNGNSCHND